MLVFKAERNKQRYLIFIDVSTHSTKIIQEIKLFNQKIKKRIAFDLFRAHDEELNKFYLVSCLLSSNFIVYTFFHISFCVHSRVSSMDLKKNKYINDSARYQFYVGCVS